MLARDEIYSRPHPPNTPLPEGIRQEVRDLSASRASGQEQPDGPGI